MFLQGTASTVFVIVTSVFAANNGKATETHINYKGISDYLIYIRTVLNTTYHIQIGDLEPISPPKEKCQEKFLPPWFGDRAIILTFSMF